ncbi:MAG TPA: hypothetical protein VMN60_01470 [Longimicrobiales bacterium]|nr:hypothetical protein [Longimicrobiales bacterium]
MKRTTLIAVVLFLAGAGFAPPAVAAATAQPAYWIVQCAFSHDKGLDVKGLHVENASGISAAIAECHAAGGQVTGIVPIFKKK